jgi:hypothetical protein
MRFDYSPLVEDPPSPRSELWVVSTYFNPRGYKSKRANLVRFLTGLREQGVPFRIAECAFGNAPFDLPPCSSVLHVRTPDVIWQKERLLNLLVSALPAECTKIAWLDCDLLFEDPSWHSKLSLMLDTYTIVQPFSYAAKLPRGQDRYVDGSTLLPSFAFIATQQKMKLKLPYKGHGHPGYAWAARREWLSAHALYDACVIGGGDHLMAHAFTGKWPSRCNSQIPLRNRAFKEHFKNWTAHIDPSALQPIGYVEGRILHLWHGEARFRHYSNRHRLLNRTGFDPKRDLTLSPQGTWVWSESAPKPLKRLVAHYFAARREDFGVMRKSAS